MRKEKYFASYNLFKAITYERSSGRYSKYEVNITPEIKNTINNQTNKINNKNELDDSLSQISSLLNQNKKN